MVEVDIPYGENDVIKLNIPDSNLSTVVDPNKVEIGDERETLYNSINNPINSKSFQEFLSDAKDVLFIVNDATRPTPTAKVLELLYDDIKDINSKFIIATGIHREPTEDEYKFIFGKHLPDFRDRIYSHDAKKDEDMVHIGTSKNGTEMYVNKMAVEAHKLVIIGSVEPHYFGGYTGGRKAFLPGIASYKTIEQNHKYALKPSSKTLALDGNPVHEDMVDAIKTIHDKEIFAIMTVLDRDHKLYAATSGHLNDSFYAAIDKANDVFCVKVEKKADVVITVAPYPMDIDLYQSQKALETAKLALNEGGTIILVSKCRTGVGHDSFVQLMSTYDTPEKTLDHIKDTYVIGYHKAAKMAEIALWAEMKALTSIDDEIIKSIFMEPIHDLQAEVDKLIQEKGDNTKILILTNGSITVPMLD
jgi:nickel-dependent lactate racemase